MILFLITMIVSVSILTGFTIGKLHSEAQGKREQTRIYPSIAISQERVDIPLRSKYNIQETQIYSLERQGIFSQCGKPIHSKEF